MPKTCELCGGEIRSHNQFGVCMRNATCWAEHARRARAKWGSMNPNLVRDSNRHRRALRHGVPNGPINDRLLFESQHGLCGVCSLPVDPDRLHVDHIIPLSKGGWHMMFNAQITHPPCNLRKGDRVDESSRQVRGVRAIMELYALIPQEA